MNFNEQQLKIVKHINGPLLCIAGPGSGKTTSIIGRVQNMVENGIDPSSILVVTFTKAAADEMKSRYEKLPSTKQGVTFSTIHAICFRILRNEYPEKMTKDSILQEFDQRNFIKEKIKGLYLEKSDQDFIITSILGAISNIKNNDISPYAIDVDGCKNNEFVEIYQAYENYKIDEGYIDFDDMISMTDKLFSERPDVLNLWRKKFSYLIIDEFQDTNKLQSQIFYNLAYPKNNICVVGDDDQCIYKFRGAVPQVMLDFEKQFENCTKVILNTNYRSAPNIVEETKRLIEHNKTRFDKSLDAFHKEDGKITYTAYKNRDKEISDIIKQLKSRQRRGETLEDIAVLYRTNNQAQQIAQMFTKADVPFYTNEPVYHIYEHWIFRDILNFKKVVDGTCSIYEFLMVVNRPNKYISKKLLPSVYSEEGVMKSVFKITESWKRDKMRESLDDFYFWIDKMSDMKPSDMIDCIRKQIKYDDFIKTYAESNKLDISQFVDVINEIQDSASMFQTFDEWLDFTKKELEEFKDKIRSKKKENSVVLSTMHKAKGLEWRDVYIVDANEEITPYYKAESDEDIEDERRMFYVAATRAKSNLYICYFEKRNKSQMSPSRFIKEMQPIKEEHVVKQDTSSAINIDFKPQMWVFHKTFGSGIITNISNNKIQIAFSISGMKTLDLKWCNENLEVFNK